MSRVELYKFSTTESSWLKTSSNVEQSHLGEIYVPAVVSRSSIELKNEIAKSAISVEIDIFDELAVHVLSNLANLTLSLSVFVKTDTLVGVGWKGRLSNALPSETILKLSFENIFTTLNRPGLKQRWQKTCRHNLYQRGCSLDRNDFEAAGAVSALSTEIVLVPEANTHSDGFFTLGILQVVGGEQSLIVSHIGSELILQHPSAGLSKDFTTSGYGNSYGAGYGGVAVRLYPGCDKLTGTCHSKFNNLVNYGGFPYIPSRNPMDGSSII